MWKLFRVAEVLLVGFLFVYFHAELFFLFSFWMLLNIITALATQSLLLKTVIKKLFIINLVILDSE